jgi:subtilisin family serine protease
MRRFVIAIACLLIAGDVMAAPRLVGRVGMVARGQLAADVIGDAARDGRALVTARVRGGADVLRRAGFEAQPLTSDIVQLRLTASELGQLARHPDVQVIEERRLLRPMLNQSAPAIGAPVARIINGVDGSGVLVGVIDTGVDFRHADLRHADGTTRIAGLLDVANARALHPELPDYNGAAVWLRADIDAVLSAEAAGGAPQNPIQQADSNGHGTHVAGIVASNGLATGNGLAAGRYVGIAPGADLVIAQATHGGNTFTDGDIITGCQFALDEAAREGRPLAVNLSLGGDGGPHDGSTDLEVALDELFPADAPGRALVIAAGNEGDLDRHAGGWMLQGELDVPMTLPVTFTQGNLSVEVWYLGALSIEVDSPTGDVYGPVQPGASFTSSNNQVGIDNGGALSPGLGGRQGATIAVNGPTGAGITVGTWTIRMRGNAHRWDAWIVDEPGPSGITRFTSYVAEDNRLALPAATHNAIIVGSFVTRDGWTTSAGEMVTRTVVVGDVSNFTPAGPTTDGRFAPDLLAPGEYIISALSRDAPATSMGSAFYVGATDPQFAVADDGVHGILRGTSQAVPHVTGTLALMLQANPQLTPSQLREILRVTAKDGGRGYAPRVGFGMLDVLGAMGYVSGARGSNVSAGASSVGVSRDLLPPGDDTTIASVTPRADDGTPLGPGHDVSIMATAGTPTGPVVDTGDGRYERSFAAHAARGTVATISAVVDGVSLSSHPSVYFVFSRAEIGQQFVARGGCSFSPGATIPAGTLLLLALLLVTHAVRSRHRRLRRKLPG